MSRHLLIFGVMLTIVFLAGCTAGGPPTHFVRGKVSNGGQPMEVKPMVGRLRLWLLQQGVAPPVDPKDAVIQPDGSFEVKGAGPGVVEGKYQVCITWQDDFPRGKDKLGGKFSEANSKIFIQVPAGKEINIDVSRPEG